MDGISLCTAFLGVFLAIPLAAMARRRPANLWLGLFIFSISCLSVADAVYAAHPELFGLLDWPLATLGPFYYCYVRSLTGLGNGRRQIIHFVPVFVVISALLWARLSFPLKTVFIWLFDARDHFGIFLLGFQLLAAAYIAGVLVQLKHYRRKVRENYASTKGRDLIWLVWLSSVIVGLLLLWLPATLLAGSWQWALVIGRIATLYFVGWYGIRQATVFLVPIASDDSALTQESAAEPPSKPAQAQTLIVDNTIPDKCTDGEANVDAISVPDKYARSGMTDSAQQLIGERLARRMSHERDYLDSEITLSELAERIGTSPQLLSQYLNHVLGLNFFDYINSLRVAEVQRMMCDATKADETLLQLAFAAGFNSKSTFNNSFKKINGLAPSSWRSLHARMSEPIG